jgi:putative FmdB family regulatory protein
MPTYAYRCSACSHEFDAFQKFSEDPLTECPNCGSAIHRVFQPVGVVFKGSGWYINDSRSKSSTIANSDSSSKSDKSDTKADKATDKSPTPATTSSESAPAAKAAAD